MNKKGPRPKHVPQRSCLACREKTDKRRLTRLVRTVEDGVVADPTGKRNGRGAYLCERPECWEKALNSGLLERVLGVTVSQAEREAIAAYRPPTVAQRAS